MTKKYQLLFSFFGACLFQIFSATNMVSAEPVKMIDVQGNTRLDKEAVVNYLPFNIGDNPSRFQIDNAVKALLGSDLFSNVQIVSDGNGAYLVKVKENPIISKIFFEGNDKYDDETLKSEVIVREGATLTEARIKTSMLRLRDLYSKSGRLEAKIEPEIIERDDNRVDFIFKISEGEIIYVEDIVFIGNNNFSDRKLRSAIETTEDAWWRFFTSNSTYDEDRLQLDKSKLMEFYQQKGFIDFAIESATAELNSDRDGFVLKFVVNEGNRYEIDKILVNDKLTNIDKDDIYDYVDQSEGDYYNRTSVQKSEEDIVIFLSEKAYPFVDVQGRVERVSDNKVNLVYDITETDPSYIERINVSGNSRTLEEVVRRRLSLVEGDPLNRSLLKKSERDLNGTGFFSKVDFIERPGSKPGAVDVKVDVEEQSTGDITFGVGYSTVNSALAEVSLSERNFLGYGQQVRVGALFSGRRQEFDLGFTEPYLMGRELAGGFDVYHITSNYRQEASFQERNSGFVLRSGFKLAEDLNLSPRYRLNADEVTNLTDNVSAVVRDSANRGQLIGSSLGYELSYDKRDDFINPTAGYVLQLNQDASGLGGDVKAVKSIATAKYFYTPITDFTFAWGLEGGAVVPLSGYDLRIIDRNLLGGQSFRGFDVAGLGPRFIPAPGTNFNNDAVGGQYFTVLHSELGFPLPGLDDLGMAGVLFNDTGSLWGVGNKPNLGTQGTIKDDTALRSSVGFGLKWRSPVGPIRLDFSHPFLKKKYDQTQLFLFSAGSSF